jgi:hypothetical protein
MLIDRTSVLTSLVPVERSYTSLGFEGNFPSAWTDFPDKYKITGFQFNTNNHQKRTRRKTLTILEVFGITGGLMRFVNLFLGKIISFFSGSAISSLLAKALYTWTKTVNHDVVDSFKKGLKSRFKVKPKKLDANGQYEGGGSEPQMVENEDFDVKETHKSILAFSDKI